MSAKAGKRAQGHKKTWLGRASGDGKGMGSISWGRTGVALRAPSEIWFLGRSVGQSHYAPARTNLNGPSQYVSVSKGAHGTVQLVGELGFETEQHTWHSYKRSASVASTPPDGGLVPADADAC